MKNGNFYVKSNELISSYYKGSLMEYKLFAISLMNTDRFFKGDDGFLYSRLTASEIKSVMKGNDGSFYRNLSLWAYGLVGRPVGIKNEETGYFCYISVITKAEYKDGVLTIQYHPEAETYLKRLSSKFTKLSPQIMMAFSSEYAFRMYEILKSKCYESRDKEYEFIYSLSELKFLLGVLNAENKSAKEVYEKTLDFDKMEEALPVKEQKYTRWDNFKKRVLDIMEREINEKSDMIIKFFPLRFGKDGTINKVAIRCSFKQEDAGMEKDNLDPLKKKLRQEKLNLSEREIETIVSLPGCTMQALDNAIGAYDAAAEVKNTAAFLTKAVKEGWEAPVAKKKKNGYYFENQRDYDYDELEKMLVNK